MTADTRRTAARALRTGVLAASLLTLGACEWFTDFKQQPKVDPWETANDTTPFRGQPQYSVPYGGETVAGFQVSYAPMPATIDSMSSIANPVAADARSLANGHKYYAINCMVCHGEKGMGDGPATKYGMAGINIVGPATQGRSDGYIFGMIRNGRGLMPTYNRIEEMDRWDVVNYVRGLQGRYPVPTGAVGRPGETGATLPGATRLGPTRAAPHAAIGTAVSTPGAAPAPGAPNDTTGARPGAPATDTTAARRTAPKETQP